MDSANSSLNGLANSAQCKSKSFNYWWRLLATGLSFAVFGLGTLLLGILFLTISQIPFQQATKQRWFRGVMHNSAKAYITSMSALGLLTFSKIPQSGITASGQIVTANHPTLLDAVFIISMCENLCCITKRALWSNPFTTSVVRMAGYIRNDADDFIEQAANKLNNGENLLIFPEGTRNSYDDQLDFKRGAANLAILAESDIIPVVIKCRPRTLQKNEKWYQIPKTAPHYTVAALTTLKTAEHIHQQAPRTIQYRQLTSTLQRIYKESLTQKNLLEDKRT